MNIERRIGFYFFAAAKRSSGLVIHYSLFTIYNSGAALAKLVRSSPIHSHPFDAPNANDLSTDIIAAIALIRKRYQLLRGLMEIAVLVHNARHVVRAHSAVQPVAAEQQHIVRDYLRLVDINIDEKVVTN